MLPSLFASIVYYFFSLKINILLINTSLIAFVSTFYLTKLMNSQVVFLIWVCSIYFTFCGIYVIMVSINELVRLVVQINFISYILEKK